MPIKRSHTQPGNQVPASNKRQFLDKDAFQRYRQERDAARREANRIVREKFFKVNSAVSQDNGDPPAKDLAETATYLDDDNEDNLTEDQFIALRAQANDSTSCKETTSTQSELDLANILSS